jgi:hypothetical protein
MAARRRFPFVAPLLEGHLGRRRLAARTVPTILADLPGSGRSPRAEPPRAPGSGARAVLLRVQD